MKTHGINVNIVINLIQDAHLLSAAKALRSITDIPFADALEIVERVEKYIDSCDPSVRNHSRIMRVNLEWVIQNELNYYISEYDLVRVKDNYMMIMKGESVVMTIANFNNQFCFYRSDSESILMDKEAALLVVKAITMMSE